MAKTRAKTHGGRRPGAGRPVVGRTAKTKTFSLPLNVIEKLDALPRGEASRLVTRLLLEHWQREES